MSLWAGKAETLKLSSEHLSLPSLSLCMCECVCVHAQTMCTLVKEGELLPEAEGKVKSTPEEHTLIYR